MTIDQMITRAGVELVDPNHNRFTSAAIVYYLNDAQREFARLTRVCRKKSGALTVSTATPAASLYTLPSDFLELEVGGVWLQLDGGGEKRLPIVSLSELPDGWSTAGGTPTNALDMLELGITELRLYPYPDDGAAWAAATAYALGATARNNGNVYTVTTAGTSAGSGGPSGTGTGITDNTVVWEYTRPITDVRIYYSYQPADMVASSGTTTAIPQAYHLALVNYAVAKCLLTSRDDQDLKVAQVYMDMYSKDLAAAKLQTARRLANPRRDFYQEPF